MKHNISICPGPGRQEEYEGWMERCPNILERRHSFPDKCLGPILGSFHLSQTISVTWNGDTWNGGTLFTSALRFPCLSWLLFSFLNSSSVLVLLCSR